MNPKEYDVLVLGSGEGGKFIAWNLAKNGQKVGVIEISFIVPRSLHYFSEVPSLGSPRITVNFTCP